ncbi:MAG TPA: hypothetical protein VE907_05040 [Gammaproteobacteria bacterium]|nr:hypothetical protein [Gammaproteobacteria bacterium]
MNKSTKKRLLDQHRRKAAALRDRPLADNYGADRRGSAKAVGGTLSFDSYPSNVSVKELEAYLDEAWRMIGSDKSWDE